MAINITKNFLTSVFVCLFICNAGSAGAGLNPLSVDTLPDSINPTGNVFFLEDPSGSLSIEQVLAFSAEKWIRNKKETINFGYSDSAFWIIFSLGNSSGELAHRIMEIRYPVLDYINVYCYHNENLFKSFETGDKFPFIQRPIQHRNFLFPLEIPADGPLKILIRVSSQSSIQIPIVVEKEHTMLEKNQAQLPWLGFYYGTMVVMALYNLFVFITIREKSLFYYVFYVAAMCLFLASLNGISYQFLWPESVWWNDQSIVFSLGAVILFAILFTRHFLDIPDSSPRLNRFCGILAAYNGVVLALSFVIPYQNGIILLNVNALLMISVAFFIGIYRWVQNFHPARYYITAWAAMLIGGIILALNKLGIIPRTGFTEYAIQFGSAIEVILLSLAMGDRLNREKADRIHAQLKALENEGKAREAQAKALEIQKKANESLEKNVFLRTKELEELNAKLKELSITDALTGLNNRRYFNEVYHAESIRSIRNKTPLSFLIIDVDHFKNFNDSYGHLEGDDCLRIIADGIRSTLLRESDFVARYGGEEFCILLPNTDIEGATFVAENIRSHIEDIPIMVDGRRVPVTVSIGVACEIPGSKKDMATLLSNADEALYKSKKNGRNRVTLFSTET